MKKWLSIFALFFSLNIPRIGHALDWIELHEKADATGLSEAISASENNHGGIEELYVLGLVYLNTHKDKEAAEVFNRILSLDPAFYQAKWGLAEAMRRQYQIDPSEKMLTEIIKSSPDFSPAYITLAYIKYTRTEFEQAVRLALKVIKQGRESVDLSNYTRAYLLVAGSKGMIASGGGPLSKMINGTSVLPNLKRAERLQPDSPVVLFGLGSFYFLAPAIAGGDIDKALDYLERAIVADPLFADAYVRLAQIHKAKGNDDKSRRYLEEALKIDPRNELATDFKNKRCKFNCITVKQ